MPRHSDRHRITPRAAVFVVVAVVVLLTQTFNRPGLRTSELPKSVEQAHDDSVVVTRIYEEHQVEGRSPQVIQGQQESSTSPVRTSSPPVAYDGHVSDSDAPTTPQQTTKPDRVTQEPSSTFVQLGKWAAAKLRNLPPYVQRCTTLAALAASETQFEFPLNKTSVVDWVMRNVIRKGAVWKISKRRARLWARMVVAFVDRGGEAGVASCSSGITYLAPSSSCFGAAPFSVLYRALDISDGGEPVGVQRKLIRFSNEVDRPVALDFLPLIAKEYTMNNSIVVSSVQVTVVHVIERHYGTNAAHSLYRIFAIAQLLEDRPLHSVRVTLLLEHRYDPRYHIGFLRIFFGDVVSQIEVVFRSGDSFEVSKEYNNRDPVIPVSFVELGGNTTETPRRQAAYYCTGTPSFVGQHPVAMLPKTAQPSMDGDETLKTAVQILRHRAGRFLVNTATSKDTNATNVTAVFIVQRASSRVILNVDAVVDTVVAALRDNNETAADGFRSAPQQVVVRVVELAALPMREQAMLFHGMNQYRRVVVVAVHGAALLWSFLLPTTTTMVVELVVPFPQGQSQMYERLLQLAADGRGAHHCAAHMQPNEVRGWHIIAGAQNCSAANTTSHHPCAPEVSVQEQHKILLLNYTLNDTLRDVSRCAATARRIFDSHDRLRHILRGQ